MDVRNCRTCGKLFNYVTGPATCPQCKDALEEKFQEVKAYVYQHIGCSIAEVSEECEVTTQQIKQWLREERLEFSSESAVGLSCEKCGVTIRSGRFCEKCKVSMANELQGAIKKPKPVPVEKPKNFKDNPRMRYLDREEK